MTMYTNVGSARNSKTFSPLKDPFDGHEYDQKKNKNYVRKMCCYERG